MYHKFAKRAAFTMLELIMVILILGIVSSIASELIVQVYQSYIVQNAQHRASLKTELAALQIANRLSASVPGTLFRIKDDNSYESISTPMTAGTGDEYVGLQWVGSDMDGFNFYDSANDKMGWSGFCDLDASTATSIATPGSSLSTVNTIITNLGGGSLPTNSPSLYFAYDTTNYPISTYTGESITLSGAGASTIMEHYKLAWSSYALVVENENLVLYYFLPPSPMVALTTANVRKSILLEGVKTFKFQGSSGTIRFKLCKDEEIGQDFNITSCKEKAVF